MGIWRTCRNGFAKRFCGEKPQSRPSQEQEVNNEPKSKTYCTEDSSPSKSDPIPGTIDEIRACGINFGSTGRRISKDCVLKPLFWVSDTFKKGKPKQGRYIDGEEIGEKANDDPGVCIMRVVPLKDEKKVEQENNTMCWCYLSAIEWEMIQRFRAVRASAASEDELTSKADGKLQVLAKVEGETSTLTPL